MNWKNIDLNSSYERSQPVLDPYDVETLLLEISCNIRDINRLTVMQHIDNVLLAKISEARQIFADNLDNIVDQL